MKLQSGRQVSRNCPECGQPLVMRQNRKQKNWFLGCLGWPECGYSQNIPETVWMEQAGYAKLPGME